MNRYPWWPAYIKTINEKRLQPYEVVFLGDFTRSFVNAKQLKIFILEELPKGITKKDLRLSINNAIDIIKGKSTIEKKIQEFEK